MRGVWVKVPTFLSMSHWHMIDFVAATAQIFLHFNFFKMQQSEMNGGNDREKKKFQKMERKQAKKAILRACQVFCNSVELPELIEMFHSQHTSFVSQPMPLVDIKEERQYVYLHGEVSVLLGTLYHHHPSIK
jgi:quinol-cytochrome oxidoreductase complex cytochrome b subunit